VIVRVYNDHPDYQMLQEDLIISQHTGGKQIMAVKPSFIVLEDAKEEKEKVKQLAQKEQDALKQRFDADMASAKERAGGTQQEELQRLKAGYTQEKNRLRDKMKSDLAAIKEDADMTAGGPGGWIETFSQDRILVSASGEKLRLPPGTQIRHTTTPDGEAQITVLSGPLMGKSIMAVRLESFSPNFDLQPIHDYYQRVI
jgi:hypothetical protein